MNITLLKQEISSGLMLNRLETERQKLFDMLAKNILNRQPTDTKTFQELGFYSKKARQAADLMWRLNTKKARQQIQ